MKIAQLFILVRVPDDFVGNSDDVVRFVHELPPGATPYTKAIDPDGQKRVSQLVADLTQATWPELVNAIDHGRSAAVVVCGQEWSDEKKSWSQLDVNTWNGPYKASAT